ncbi:unnamed protein product [Kuraishia capsulata CBS 1993]|uniref:SRR1-like domain-containing protein n=1 Tax=Kuraishia capsulata CBS 1993 TaxID=1382522 RepID=W6MFR4_9ASCO|nr:uncharacterized protein KUCA_T00000183001 [Kuraishia capsulata CBS 1993]CDK24223.1 unnamed protein product [Kuraishia capsulata CBS 1993]
MGAKLDVESPEARVEKLKRTREMLGKRRDAFAKTKTYADALEVIRNKLANIDIVSVRCLALGSPSNEFNALYQLAFLVLILDELKIRQVSVYDPAFNDIDVLLFEELGFKIEDKITQKVSKEEDILYYMPHAPVELLEEIITSEKIVVMITNDLRRYIGRWTSQDLYEKHPNVARIGYLTSQIRSEQPSTDDGFEMVASKKKVRKNRRNKLKVVDTNVDYHLDECYFDSCDIAEILGGSDISGEWKDSFSCLAVHVIR